MLFIIIRDSKCYFGRVRKKGFGNKIKEDKGHALYERAYYNGQVRELSIHRKAICAVVNQL